MNTLLQAVLGFCAAAVFLGAVSMLCPTGNMSKIVKYAFCVIFLCVSVSIFGSFSKLKAALPAANTTQTAPDLQKLTAVQSESVCRAALLDNNISVDKISVLTDIQQDSSIKITKITVYCNENPETVRQILQKIVIAEKVEVFCE